MILNRFTFFLVSALKAAPNKIGKKPINFQYFNCFSMGSLRALSSQQDCVTEKMLLSDIVSIYTNLCRKLVALFIDFWNSSKNLLELKKLIKSIILWQMQLFVTNTYMCMYFWNYSFAGRPLLLGSCVIVGGSGPYDSNAIFIIGFIGVVLFFQVNIMFYTLVQINLFKDLLVNAIGSHFFKEFVGYNMGARAASKGLAHLKAAGLIVLGLTAANETMHVGKTIAASIVFDAGAPDQATLSETGKLDLVRQRSEFIHEQAPYKTVLSRIIEPQVQLKAVRAAKAWIGLE